MPSHVAVASLSPMETETFRRTFRFYSFLLVEILMKFAGLKTFFLLSNPFFIGEDDNNFLKRHKT